MISINILDKEVTFAESAILFSEEEPTEVAEGLFTVDISKLYFDKTLKFEYNLNIPSIVSSYALVVYNKKAYMIDRLEGNTLHLISISGGNSTQNGESLIYYLPINDESSLTFIKGKTPKENTLVGSSEVNIPLVVDKSMEGLPHLTIDIPDEWKTNVESFLVSDYKLTLSTRYIKNIPTYLTISKQSDTELLLSFDMENFNPYVGIKEKGLTYDFPYYVGEIVLTNIRAYEETRPSENYQGYWGKVTSLGNVYEVIVDRVKLPSTQIRELPTYGTSTSYFPSSFDQLEEVMELPKLQAKLLPKEGIYEYSINEALSIVEKILSGKLFLDGIDNSVFQGIYRGISPLYLNSYITLHLVLTDKNKIAENRGYYNTLSIPLCIYKGMEEPKGIIHSTLNRLQQENTDSPDKEWVLKYIEID